MSYYSKTLENLENHIEKGRYNFSGPITNRENMTGFLCESLVADREYKVKFIVDKAIEHLRVIVEPRISIPKAYRAVAAQFCSAVTDRTKAIVFNIDDRGCIYGEIGTYYCNGAITQTMLAEMENLLYRRMSEYSDVLRKISTADFFTKDMLETAADKAMKRLMEEDDDDMPDGFPSLGEILRRHRRSENPFSSMFSSDEDETDDIETEGTIVPDEEGGDLHSLEEAIRHSILERVDQPETEDDD